MNDKNFLIFHVCFLSFKNNFKKLKKMKLKIMTRAPGWLSGGAYDSRSRVVSLSPMLAT